MKVKVFVGNKQVNEISQQEWIDLAGDDEYFMLLDHRVSIEDSVSNYNLNQKNAGSNYSAVVVYEN
jgi:hypothetical protein